MYSDRVRKRWPVVIFLLLVILAAGLLIFTACSRSTRDMSSEATVSVKEAVERAALQCYVVEGAYPSDLAYLQDNYGLSVNTRDFYIHYDAFASNLPPDVRVEVKPEAHKKEGGL